MQLRNKEKRFNCKRSFDVRRMILGQVGSAILETKLISPVIQCCESLDTPEQVENSRRCCSDRKIKKLPKERITRKLAPHVDEPIPYSVKLKTCIFLLCLTVIGMINDFLEIGRRNDKKKGYIPLYGWRERFFKNRIYRRIWFARDDPIVSHPGPIINVVDRESPDHGFTVFCKSGRRNCVNLGSYNYLNLSDVNSPCIPGMMQDFHKFGIANCTTRNDFSTTIHEKLDKAVARFLGVEAACTYAMGFATNSLNIPSIIDGNCLVISDEFNHASIIVGLKSSGAALRVFKHNDMKDLERKIRAEIVMGNSKGKPWDKIFIMVEGVYSMHGDFVRLPEIVDLKNKYGAYLYLDEAHCMGAVGKTGRGVTEYFNVDPKQVDILMGTFAKAFGAMGGYIAGSKQLIDSLTKSSQAHCYGTCMSAPIASFILEGINFLFTNPEAPLRLENLRRNACYFRGKLKQLGYIVFGDEESPVVPVIIPSGTLPYLIVYMRERNVAAVLVSYPATPLAEGRIRCCLNALHTKEMLDYVLNCFKEAADLLNINLSKLPRRNTEIMY